MLLCRLSLYLSFSDVSLLLCGFSDRNTLKVIFSAYNIKNYIKLIYPVASYVINFSLLDKGSVCRVSQNPVILIS